MQKLFVYRHYIVEVVKMAKCAALLVLIHIVPILIE